MIIEDAVCPKFTRRMLYQGLRYCLLADELNVENPCKWRTSEKYPIVSNVVYKKDLKLSKCLYLGEMNGVPRGSVLKK